MAFSRGGWIGLTAKHTRADMIRAVLEGVAYSQMDCLQIIENMGVEVKSVRLSGGGAKSPFWRQMFADVFGKRVVTLESQEGSAYGAALLGMVATGAFGSLSEACAATIREVDVIEPGTDRSIHAHGYKTYQALYPALKGVAF